MNPESPFTKLRFCPVCGTNAFLPDSGKSLKCGVCGFKFYINMSGAVVAIIRNEAGKALFTVRKHAPAQGKLDLPGGFVDLGETAEHAVQREVLEELNLTVNELRFFGTFPNTYLFGGIEYYTLDIVFECTVNDFSTLQANDDVTEARFLFPSEVKREEIGLDSMKIIVERLRS